ncbi:hypothetical protein MBLNU457_4099t1 [Dothideomycetes sp. NU457]
MWLDLHKLFNRLSHDPDVRAIILTSSGDRAFTAGLDIQAAGDSILSRPIPDVARKANLVRRHVSEFQECITAIEQCEKPVICAIHGICYGLGLDISLACDIRLAAKNARLSIKEVDIGIAADIGTLSRLPHSGVPFSWIKDVAMTARDFGAEEALGVGLVSGIYDGKDGCLKAAMEKATLLASKSPVAVLGTKHILNYSRERTVADGLNYTAVWNAAYTQTRDMTDAMTASLKKKKSSFAKL